MTFREALVYKLHSIGPLAAIVGDAIYPYAIPETHDLARDGPAVTYTVISSPRDEQLDQLGGTSLARIQLSAWSYSLALSDQVSLAILGSLRRMPVGIWGDGSCVIMSISHGDESDQPEVPQAATDQWVRQIVSEYNVKYRVSL